MEKDRLLCAETIDEISERMHRTVGYGTRDDVVEAIEDAKLELDELKDKLEPSWGIIHRDNMHLTELTEHLRDSDKIEVGEIEIRKNEILIFDRHYGEVILDIWFDEYHCGNVRVTFGEYHFGQETMVLIRRLMQEFAKNYKEA